MNLFLELKTRLENKRGEPVTYEALASALGTSTPRIYQLCQGFKKAEGGIIGAAIELGIKEKVWSCKEAISILCS